MAVSVNRVILAGNLTRDPQVKFLASEQAVCNFGLALNRRYKARSGEMVDEVTYVDIEAWGRTGELVGQYLTKGRSCLVEGRLKLDSWEKDGQKQSRLRVVAESVQFLGGREDGGARSSGGPREDSDESYGDSTPRSSAPSSSSPPPPAYDDDEPPF
ncbi:MAG: single-stranded DNA-binding protein [Planctomycetota bacterium]|nr:MAG: single-stranded DNA-binding protein [Planctomycetota bacterium]